MDMPDQESVERAAAANAKRVACEWAHSIERWHRQWSALCERAEQGGAASPCGDEGAAQTPRDIEARAAQSARAVHLGPGRSTGARFRIVLPPQDAIAGRHDVVLRGRLLGGGGVGTARLEYPAFAEMVPIEVNPQVSLAWFASLCIEAERARVKARSKAPGPERAFTVQCGFLSAHACVVEVRALNVIDACRKAVEAANTEGEWKALDEATPCYVARVGDGHTAPDVNDDHDVPRLWRDPLRDAQSI